MADAHDDLSPETAFAALDSEVRVAVLRELGAAGPGEPRYVPIDRRDVGGMAYTTLRERVGVADKGRFNYHLGELVGTFVERRDGRYHLTWPGHLAYRFLIAGLFSDAPSERAFDLPTGCPRCGAGTRARYTAEQLFFVDCTDCDCRLAMVHVPSRTGGERPRAALLDAAASRVRRLVGAVVDGVCPWCAGRLDVSLALGDADGDGADGDWLARYLPQPAAAVQCRDCDGRYFPSVGSTLLVAPRAVATLVERGVDPTDHHPWTLPFAVDGERVTVVSRDPPTVRVTVRRGGDPVAFDVDAALDPRPAGE